MSLSKRSPTGAAPGVIKLNSRGGGPEIIDYRRVIEEIENDGEIDAVVETVELDETPSRNMGDSYEEKQQTAGSDGEKKALAGAFERGFEAGKSETAQLLWAKYDEKLKEATNDFLSLVQEFAEERKKYDQDFDRAIVTLALAIARRIVAREMDIDEGAVLARSREALRKIIGVERVKIHVSPADDEYIKEHRNDLSAYADSVREIAIESDEKVERGGCIIESELGNIDARVSTQFELVEEALVGLIK